MLSNRGWFYLGFCSLLFWCVSALAVECTQCHAASADKPLHALFNTAHGNLQASDGGNSCQTCHGGSEQHASNPINTPPSVSFGPRWPSDKEVSSGQCLTCHKGGEQMFWAGSAHHQESMGCNDCHTVHAMQDPVLAKISQPDVCYGCHVRQRSEAQLPSHHPIVEGKTACADCHNPHGSSTQVMLREPTLNDTCYTCHAEKRGPFLFEHAPVSEDCSLCHTPHGSVNTPLLTSRGPALCQQCHMAAFHPSLPSTGSGIASASPLLLAKNCTSCHSQVHGSNHPSGARITR